MSFLIPDTTIHLHSEVAGKRNKLILSIVGEGQRLWGHWVWSEGKNGKFIPDIEEPKLPLLDR